MPPPHPTQAPAPTLPEELLEEIFLRLPPDEPACMARARLPRTRPAFRRRYRDFHGAPPMLGFFHSGSSDSGPHFAPTGARLPGVDGWVGWHMDHVVWDCRHGRVLLCNKNMLPLLLVAWDPMTGNRRKLPTPREYDSHGAAVLCSATGCHHRACHEGPFRVVFVGLDYSNDGCAAYAHVSLPETGEWSEPCSALEPATKNASLLDMPPVSVQDPLCFLLTYLYCDAEHANDIVVLKYDLTSHRLSLIDVPPVETDTVGDTILMLMKDGGLGFARFDGLTIYIWSRQMGSDGVPAWTQSTVMDLKNLLPIRNPKKRVRLIGSMEGSDIIFITTDLGIYKINLK
ncbi:uncharacterized protein [Lolium perenne]|uniref:uncharacterized protein n=1 Tax=Lolium perenne TaxID=4522 RepID=UPI0021F5300E|nr:uncharacterized protein LOC127346561 [Lolium perenne]